MKTTKRLFGSLLTLALAFMLALTAVVPTFAAPVDQENLTVRIRNNDGLPAMSETQFDVYQIFTGTPNKEKEAQSNDWDAENWNNYTLADIEWGASVQDNAQLTLLTALQSADWAVVDGKNVFADASTATQVAEALVGRTNKFLQNFAKTVLAIPTIKTVTLEPGNPALDSGKPDDPADDSLTFTLPDTGYYLFAENAAEHTEGDAVSEYMLAVVGEQDILLKASVPTVDKTITDGENDSYKGDVEGVGKVVEFDLKGTLPKNFNDFDTYYYKFTDTLSKGLTFDPKSVVVTVKAKDGTIYTIDPSQYALFSSKLSETDESTLIVVAFNDLKHGDNETTDEFEEGLNSGLKYTKKGDTAGTGYVVLDPDAEIHVAYKATVNTNAVIGVEGNPNDVDLTYSNDPNSNSRGKTEKVTVYVYAFGLDLTKVGSDNPEAGLEGAGFVLKDKDGHYAIFEDQYVDTTGKNFADAQDSTHQTKVRRLTGWTTADQDAEVEKLIAAYDTAKKDFDKASDTEQQEPDGTAYKALQKAKNDLAQYLLVSEKEGAIPDIYGLDEGKFALQEVITPDGYNTMDDFSFTIQAEVDTNGELQGVTYTPDNGLPVRYDNFGNENVPNETAKAVFRSGLLPEKLVNQKAPFLPFTGGMGTLIFYILGAVLIAGAVTYLVIASKKRKKAQENT